MTIRQMRLWVVQLRVGIVCAGDILAGVLVGWVPSWHNSPSLVRFGHLVDDQWWILGSLLLLAAVLVVRPDTRVWGYRITAVIFILAGFWLTVVSTHAPQKNALAVVGLLMLGALLLLGIASAQIDRGRRRDEP